MQKRLEIGSRLKELRKERKFSQQYVAENLFISQAAYSLIENSQNGIVAEHIINLSKMYEVTTDYILKGDKHLIRISPTQGFVPYVQANAHAGYVKNYSKSLDNEDYEWFKIPGFNPGQEHMLFEVEGESMVPTILSGDIVICQVQKNWDNILDSSIVLFLTKKSLLIKRIRIPINPEELSFVNDNPENSEVLTFKKADIRDIFMVKGKISNMLSPQGYIASQEKMHALEESIELLKKELNLIKMKLQDRN